MIHMLVIANRLSQTQENMDLEICKPENGYKNFHSLDAAFVFYCYISNGTTCTTRDRRQSRMMFYLKVSSS